MSNQPAHEDRPARERVRARDGDGDGDGESGGHYQTMCVRTCDGYYWPLHYPTSRRDFRADEASCQAACGTETRLYYRSGPGVDAEEMTGLDGASYGSSATAFAYRKGLINGCTCRPMPWSDGEKARHEGYALVEQEKALRVAQAEAERAAVVAEAEAAKSRPKENEPIAAMVARVLPVAREAGPPIGPNEALVMAAGGDGAAGTAVGPASGVPAKPVNEADGAVTAKVRRNAHEGRHRPPVRMASAPSQPGKPAVLAWLGGTPGKFTYPGDAPRR